VTQRQDTRNAGSRLRIGLRTLAAWVADRRGRLEPVAYTAFAAVCTLYVAHLFIGSMRQQIEMLYASLDRDAVLQLQQLGRWSAPLDDVFIHFDFARSTARGYPFAWSETNGYSSGGTSLLYPFVLALGYRIGFRELTLMLWAALVACVCVFGLLLAVRRAFRDLPVWTSYVAPPALLCAGALDWCLWSGMEVALLLGLWGAALVVWDEVWRRAPDAATTPRQLVWLAVGLGLLGAALVATRPEAACAVAVFAVGAAIGVRRRGLRSAGLVLLLVALPGVLVVVAHAVANRALTGESSAAGALAKLELYDPFMSPGDVYRAWRFNLEYQVRRVTEYHLCDDGRHGWIVWGLGLIPLFSRATRRTAVLCWTSAALWVALVALNGQVRWQNERYTMPAVAWVLVAATLGVAVAVSARPRGRAALWIRVAMAASVVLAASLFLIHQRPRFREQVWFFGRASRNILEQHVRAGLFIRTDRALTPRRVLVGDAGAIPYAADLPALDIIGLGGYRGLPFARATRLGVAAAVELIERMPRQERPDLLAIYPSWWGDFPLWFGRRITEVPVHDNVICGGPSKVIYAADWSPLDASARPVTLGTGERVVDELDFADLVNERDHDYRLSRPRVGHVEMKVLGHPERPEVGLWDAGRIVPSDVTESFVLRGLSPSRSARLLVRAAPAAPASFAIAVDGRRVATIQLVPADSWQEYVVTLPSELVVATLSLRIEGVEGTRVLHHLWAVQRP
jgi:hypothetical protein